MALRLLTKPDSLPRLQGLGGESLKAEAQTCLTELRLLSSALTTQVLALLPMQAALVAGFALAEKKDDPGDVFEILTIASLGLAVMCSVYALIRVHDRVLWEKANEDELKSFVTQEAQSVAAKGNWCRLGVATTLAAALAVVVCNLVVFSR